MSPDPDQHEMMVEHMPANLLRLYEAFGRDPAGPLVHLLPGDSFVVDGIEFVCDYRPGSTADRFFIVKPIEHVREFVALCEGLGAGSRIFELGIAEGGSTVLAALVAQPSRLVAIDNETHPLAALDELIERRGLGEVIRPFWGVDQSDGARLIEIVEQELDGGPLDLVLDDASHELHLTRASFETLFPYLRPGGTYIIEDWNSAHVLYDAVAAVLRDPSAPGHDEAMDELRRSTASGAPALSSAPEPLSQLAIELLLARASSGAAIAELTISEHWIAVRRGPGDLDPRAFRVRELYNDHFGLNPASAQPT